MTDLSLGASATSSRFFYSDPLAAAWMAKYFKMRFTDRAGNRFRDDEGFLMTPMLLLREMEFFVDHASLHLLHWKPGDMVETTHVVAEIVHHQDSDYLSSDFIRIIQRDGKPFFWPEREAA